MNHFIQLPDGTIYNVAFISRIEEATKEGERAIDIHIANSHRVHYDVRGDIYAYFESIAEPLDTVEGIAP